MIEKLSDLKREPRYSGPGRSGICICGHSWKQHHLGVVLNQDYYDETGESYVPQECEAHGFNETGGLGPEGEPHCDRYQDRGPENPPQS